MSVRTDVGTGRPKEPDLAALSEIVQVLNDKFGMDFKQEDQLLFDQAVGDLKQDDQLCDQAKNSTIDQFKLAFDPLGDGGVRGAHGAERGHRLEVPGERRTPHCGDELDDAKVSSHLKTE